jgi:hypothetical protein|tara:strand:+ start:2581 stop:2775 length:195 start_codon:yes stop_codon:yes gene_type:complete
MNISEFERKKPQKTRKALADLIQKYKKISDSLPIMDDEDAIKVEMASDFAKELLGLKKTFEKGE